ncbi:MAG: hypothetical protein PHD01_11410 [Geobacteraceae bacterium]|nr:hypothetical protein [Geobacteraceae bacterium]
MEKTKSFCLIAVFAFSAFLLSSVNARAVSDEARRHMDRGQAAIEMANTPADLDDAVTEFQKAIELAPVWPDPYYNLGMVQNKMERYDDALKNLKSYLQLAPNAKDAQEVKQLINKIEYKKDKESKIKRVFELLGSKEKIDCKLVSKENKGANSARNWGSPFAYFWRKDGVLGFANILYNNNYQDDASKLLYSGYMKGRQGWSSWVPVRINGRSFDFNYSYVMPGINGREGGSFVTEVSGKGEIISLDPIRTKILFTEKVSLFVTDTGVYRKQNEVYTSEILDECREK